jgi:DNA invertase Pin-like site-specific DNA recombinase
MAEHLPVAQYLRVSTEHQQYSFENQSAAIRMYAESHGFHVIRTYSDAAKSGIVLNRRHGLRQLLQDVVAGAAPYRAILVYDVSRWGRFQDTDESAHYEFLCKSAGVPVHYCAETFANDGTLPSLIMKALKRTMAGEYSRELGVKVLEGQKRLAQLGFKQGGRPGYGLKRLLVTPERRPKQRLDDGERKSIATDRVILVPGAEHEVEVVRQIYRMLISEGLSVHGIANELNRRGVPYTGVSKWDYQAVYSILTHLKYTGCHVYGRTSCRLYTPSVKLPKTDWIVTEGAFEPVVDQTTFLEAQRVLAARTINKTDEALLDSLRTLLAREGRLSLRLVKDSPDLPSPSTYRLRFGSMRRAYELIGYGRPEQFGPIDLRRRTQALREQLLASLAKMFPNEVAVVRRGGRWRGRLRIRGRLIVSVLLGRSTRVWKETVRWQIDPVQHERKYITLLALLDGDNSSFLRFYVLPYVDRSRRFHIGLTDSWLLRGLQVDDLAVFLVAVDEVRHPLRSRGK